MMAELLLTAGALTRRDYGEGNGRAVTPASTFHIRPSSSRLPLAAVRAWRPRETIAVHAGDDLQAAFRPAAQGDQIVLMSERRSGELRPADSRVRRTIVVRNHGVGATAPVRGTGQVPATRRRTWRRSIARRTTVPSPRLVSSCWRFVGLEARCAPGVANNTTASSGLGTGRTMNALACRANMVVDRCLVLQNGQRRTRRPAGPAPSTREWR